MQSDSTDLLWHRSGALSHWSDLPPLSFGQSTACTTSCTSSSACLLDGPEEALDQHGHCSSSYSCSHRLQWLTRPSHRVCLVADLCPLQNGSLVNKADLLAKTRRRGVNCTCLVRSVGLPEMLPQLLHSCNAFHEVVTCAAVAEVDCDFELPFQSWHWLLPLLTKGSGEVSMDESSVVTLFEQSYHGTAIVEADCNLVLEFSIRALAAVTGDWPGTVKTQWLFTR